MAREGRRGFGDGWRHSDPEANDGTGPIDVAAIRRDDALIEAIAGDGPVSTDDSDEYQLALLLASWRAELVAPPLPSAPDLDAVVAVVNQEIGARQVRINAAARNRFRLVRPLAGAAAAIALIAGGMTAFSYSAHPGDPLWKVKQVVFSEQANSTIAQVDANADLNEAQRLIDQGHYDQARETLKQASSRASAVGNPANRDPLLARLSHLAALADQQGAPSVVPPTPSVSTTPTVSHPPTSAPTTTPSEQPPVTTTPTRPPTTTPSGSPNTPPTKPTLPTKPAPPTGLPTVQLPSAPVTVPSPALPTVPKNPGSGGSDTNVPGGVPHTS